MRFRIMLLPLALMAGCATPVQVDPLAQYGAEQERRWLGKSVDELVAVRGQPQMTIDATLLGGPRSAGLVYPQDPSSPFDCFDTYVVELEQRTLIKYFCR